jgi:hypothetical protein
MTAADMRILEVAAIYLLEAANEHLPIRPIRRASMRLAAEKLRDIAVAAEPTPMPGMISV